MIKNFFPIKTGHKASDDYFKNLAVWHDIDIVKSWMLGFSTGSILTGLLIILFY
tara:strand:+ start:722 stop:883 length:162 start_codon:yes stop_codon:yes gene_type:complete